jgi:hypothetical protein
MGADSIKFDEGFDEKTGKYFITCEICKERLTLEANTDQQKFNLITKHVFEVHGIERGNVSRSDSN